MDLKTGFKNLKLPFLIYLFSAILIFFPVFGPFPVFSQENNSSEVRTSGEGLISKLAPGEIMPISVKLLNFGSEKKADVTINYFIRNGSDEVVFNETETVAVETTATFVKNIQIPYDLPQGKYTAISSITYKGQEVPATSSFQFTVEKKIAGIFISQFILYATVTLIFGLIFGVVSRLIMKRRASRLNPHEYSEIPREDRMFFEIISDVIMQMRYYAGTKALDIAAAVDGLVIDRDTGKVLEINKDPAEVVAVLVLQYEKQLGRRTKLSPRKLDKEAESRLKPINQNLNIIEKYFSSQK